jgi:hypothetical protein
VLGNFRIKLLNRIFPCDVVLKSLASMHKQAVNRVSESSDRVQAACAEANGLCVNNVVYNGADRRR